MTTVQDILTFMEGLAPYELAESWDNVGLLVDAGKPVDGVRRSCAGGHERALCARCDRNGRAGSG